ncbi:uncharacterized protein F5Z01DRAFT_621301 [Emericellopsis atlantica]|uniref:Glutaredoxin-like protein n=1 Tax=Emericellopsis atlantica TaxID=2614577 RepID=A0A9P8CRT7_9HYPO|nr:uncharacterized protein F5Z01DRAFT_621301 [Emericellopsis atlantica]KAG9255076.1 hypothetical protein F5Z01DRAFT_621301 [Emericellopsis atlantica]
MFATHRLLQPFATRITLFTRPGCGLCEQGKANLSQVWDKRPFAYAEENVDAQESKWRDLYDFDVPVIHISRSEAPPEDVSTASKAIKLMHRFTPAEVEAKMDVAEQKH